MKVTRRNAEVSRLLSLFEEPTAVERWVETQSDVGLYYSPTVKSGVITYGDSELRRAVTARCLEVEFPNSTLTVIGDTITIQGRRGSIEDCIAPLLRVAGFYLDDPHWRVEETTRPDVAWYCRVPVPVQDETTG